MLLYSSYAPEDQITPFSSCFPVNAHNFTSLPPYLLSDLNDESDAFFCSTQKITCVLNFKQATVPCISRSFCTFIHPRNLFNPRKQTSLFTAAVKGVFNTIAPKYKKWVIFSPCLLKAQEYFLGMLLANIEIHLVLFNLSLYKEQSGVQKGL